MGNTYGKPIDPADLINIKYDETSPTFLRFIKRTHFNQHKELVVGTFFNYKRNKCIGFCVNYNSYKAHRVIWFLYYNEDPLGFEIDHIDGNTYNNHITNLRKVPREVNVRNSRKRKDNTSGHNGIHLNNLSDGNSYWTVSWREPCENNTLNFSINKLGNDAALHQAVLFRDQKMNELRNLGLVYTDRHGK
jgi:hypothetical protein